MALRETPIGSVTENDLLSLISNQVSEGKTIEYKSSLPGKSDQDKMEFLADVASFANASGGDLLFGMEEANGVPVAVSGLGEVNCDEEILRLDSIIRDGLEPRVRGVQIQPVHVRRTAKALIVRIPRSFSAPHMVVFKTGKGNPQFYTRNSAGKHRMDVSELRASFGLTASVAERVRDFRRDRLGRVLASETPVQLARGPIIAVHLVSFGAFDIC